MGGDNRLQKILYLVMAVLAIYILYKGWGLLAGSSAAGTAADSGGLRKGLEDSAMRTYAPGYTAAVENREESSLISGWMGQIVPVYSYLAEQSRGTEEEDGEAIGQEKQSGEEAIEETEDSNQEKSGGKGKEEARQREKQEEKTASQTGGIEKKQDIAGQAGGEEQGIAGDGLTGRSDNKGETGIQEVMGRGISGELLEQLSDYNYLLSNYFTVDGGTAANEELLDGASLLSEDLSIRKNPEIPQILIYHTHSQEEFIDSVPGDPDTSIVGMGEVLADVLREKYGYQVIHDRGVYDLVDGVLDRSAAYDYARTSVQRILEENPTVEVVIDLHRDGVEGQKFVTDINGQPTSMIMFFNGISRNSQDEPISYLPNPYTAQNLAFSLQLQLKARAQYPGFTRNIYLKAERFNLHLRPRSLLIEAGTQLNTVEEERNAMYPLADLLDQVLSGV